MAIVDIADPSVVKKLPHHSGHKRVKFPIAIASCRGNPQILPAGEIPNYFSLLAFAFELKEDCSYLVDKENSEKLSAGYSLTKKLSSWFEVSYH